MSSVLTPRPRHPSRPRITTARSSPRVIRRERERQTPLGRPVINHLFPFPSVIVFFPIVSSPRRVETPSIDDRTTPNDRRRATSFAFARHRSRARSHRVIHPSESDVEVPTSRRSSHPPSHRPRRRATRREDEKRKRKRIDAHLPSRSVARSARSNADSNRSPVVASTVRDRSNSIGTSTSFSVFYYSV